MNNQTILIIDFGGQYKELIARRVREMNVFSVIKPCSISEEEVEKMSPIGIILTGGPNSVYADNAPPCSLDFEALGIPVLGICYGMQYLCYRFGGDVRKAEHSEYGVHKVRTLPGSVLLQGVPSEFNGLMSHTDRVFRLPENFEPAAETDLCRYAAFEDRKRNIYGVQFHPETELTEHGMQILHNFVYGVCHAAGDFVISDYIETAIDSVRKQVGSSRVILGLSGGVDSSVCASLISRAIGKNLICIFVDHGLLRKGESEQVCSAFSGSDLQFIHVDASERFLSKLKGVTEPEAKRKIIGAEFAHVFEEEASKFPDAKFLAQGTIYPDVVESGANKSAVIKSHHNVGGLPKNLSFTGVVEPLRGLFKDEVRKVGRILGLPESIINRQPFPGPGLAIRVIGEVTKEKLDILRDADAIFREEVDKLEDRPDQYFAVLTSMRSVGVMGDFRTYEYTAALRAVKTNDFMTAEVFSLPVETILTSASRITDEVKGINRVVFDVTPKPPATIEWE
ncbi:MAG: glutamine-hydrolyzing GMP synthase [Oscillospiraceae bacterium]|jgi:GMP synthase (glutamine-hydrolysing)